MCLTHLFFLLFDCTEEKTQKAGDHLKREILDAGSVLRIKLQAHVPYASSLDAELQSSKLELLQRTCVYVDITSIPRVCLAPSWHMAEGFYD